MVTIQNEFKLNAFFFQILVWNICSELGAGNTTNLAKTSLALVKPVLMAATGKTTS